MKEKSFDPNAAAIFGSGIYGLPCTAEEAEIIIIPVEWELTTSYNRGTVNGPKAVFDGSMQVDLCHHDYPNLWEKGIWMDEFPQELRDLHSKLLPYSEDIIDAIESGEMDENPDNYAAKYQAIEEGFEKMFSCLKERISYWKSKGKKVGLLGGDHSIPLPYHQYLNEKDIRYGILNVDAHNDLRGYYEGFKYSHASIFYNILHFENVEKLVQVGIRDYCHQEKELIQKAKERIVVFYDRDNRNKLFKGITWEEICDNIVDGLPQNVYISIDIDGLDPKLCPNTGTPVPGGLEYEELMFLLNKIKESGRKILGFDLCEVSPGEDEWDGNVGARILYHLCGMID